MNTPTTERLALALEQAGAVPEMVAAARAGRYDDFKSGDGVTCYRNSVRAAIDAAIRLSRRKRSRK